jgi:hypothetical protein
LQNRTLGKLIFPELASIQLAIGIASSPQPLHLGGVIFGVRLIAQHKTDYTLAPFATDPTGIVRMSRDACHCLVDACHDTGQRWPNGLRQVRRLG